MKLKLRAAAERDLDGIYDYSLTRYGAEAAETYLSDLRTGMDRLLIHPELGAETGLRPGLRALGIREHRAFYRVEPPGIVVARVLHKAMDAGRHL